MPEINQMFFSHKEIIEVLIKKADIHEGKWMLAANIGFAAGNFGTSPDQINPGAAVTILAVGLQRAAPDTPAAVTVDAAIVNPVKRRKV